MTYYDEHIYNFFLDFVKNRFCEDLDKNITYIKYIKFRENIFDKLKMLSRCV